MPSPASGCRRLMRRTIGLQTTCSALRRPVKATTGTSVTSGPQIQRYALDLSHETLAPQTIRTQLRRLTDEQWVDVIGIKGTQ